MPALMCCKPPPPFRMTQSLISGSTVQNFPEVVVIGGGLTLCLGFGSEKGSVYLVGMLRETRGVVVYGGVVVVGRVVVNGGGGLYC